MRRKIKNICCIILMFILTGCTSENKAEEFNIPQYIAINHDFYGNGLIYPQEWRKAYFLDFDTMNRAPLCAVPNCDHKTANCLTNSLGNTPVMYNNHAYFFGTKADVVEKKGKSEFHMESKLYRASLDSSTIEFICEFNDALVRDGEGYVLLGNKLYFIAFDPDAQDNGYGGFPWSTAGGYDYLCSIDLDSGNYTNHGLICYVEDEYPSADHTATAKILGCDNEQLYIGYSFAKWYPEHGDTGEEDLQWEQYNFTFSFVTQELQQSNLPYAAYVDADYYIYYEDESHFTVIQNGEARHFTGQISEISAPVYNGKIFGLQHWYDLADGSEHSLGKYIVSDDDEWHCVAYYDGCYIFQQYTGTFEKLTEDELLSLQ